MQRRAQAEVVWTKRDVVKLSATAVERRTRRAGGRDGGGADRRGEDYNLLHLAHFKLLDQLEAEMGDRINDLFSVYDAEPTSLLHMAVRDDFPDVVRWLLERGANPDLVDANGLTPKQVAVTTDRSDAVRKLLGLAPRQRR